ncbi:MAG: antitoxin [Desulfohalobiaceae bacterium]
MKAITVRGVEPEMAEKLKQAASRRGTSVNRIILEMIRKELGHEERKEYSRRYNDLDELIGKWSEEEYQRISSAVENNRQIDSELW